MWVMTRVETAGLRNKRFKLRQERQKIIYGPRFFRPIRGLCLSRAFPPQLALWATVCRASGAPKCRRWI